MQIELDDIDRRLLTELQADGRLSTATLAQRCGLSQSPCWRRIKRMEDAGLIAGYHARLDRRSLGYGIMAFVTIAIDHQDETSSRAFEAAVRAIPEVVMFHGIAGAADFLLGVVARDLDHYSELLQRRLHRLPGVKQVQSSLSLQEFITQPGLPVPPRGDA